MESRAAGCCDKAIELKKGPWTHEEDQKLLDYIQEHGHGSWRTLPSKAGLQRCGKSCRLRWKNYLRPDIKRGNFSIQEEQTIIQLHALLGNRWSTIAAHLPKRTDNEIKNYWNIHMKKRLSKMGIDPTTHKPQTHASGCVRPKDFANLCHMAQWETARLEAEARLVRESKLMSMSNPNYHLLNKATTAAAAPAPPPPPRRPPCLDILKVWASTNPGKDMSNAMPNYGILTYNGGLQLNFSDDNLVPIPTVGLFNENSSITNINRVEVSGPWTAGPSNHDDDDDEMTGIFDNSSSMGIHDDMQIMTNNPLDSTDNYYDDDDADADADDHDALWNVPSLMQGFSNRTF